MTRKSLPHLIPIVGVFAFVAVFGLSRPSMAPEVKSNPATAPQASVSKPTSTDSGQLSGIDVSHFQGKIAWDKVATAGVSFAYIKSTGGNTFVDPKFATNAAGAAASKIPFGAYHFYRPSDDPTTQAKHFLKSTGSALGSLPPVLDVETAPAKGVDIVKGVQTWLEVVAQQTGCKPIIYTDLSMWNTSLKPHFKGTSIWLADYVHGANKPSDDADWIIWQHTDQGAVAGIAGTVDLDIFAGDADDLSRFMCRGKTENQQ